MTRRSGHFPVQLCMAVATGAVTPAGAHGFGARYDLPVPLWLFVTGAAAAVIISFVLMALFVRGGFRLSAHPRINLMQWRAGRAIAHPLVLASLRAGALLLFMLVVIAGFCGNQSPVKNIAPLMVWAVWWVGMAYMSALVGDLWALLNPLNTAYRWAESICARLRHGAVLSRRLPYPHALGVWPAVILFFAFAWAELNWENSDLPANVATMVLVYCAITWSGMFIFGRKTWLDHGETFALIFSVLARFAPIEACVCRAQRKCDLRPYGVGLLVNKPVHVSMMALVILMLATVTFDGFSETAVWANIAGIVSEYLSAQASAPAPDYIRTIVYTLGLAAIALIFLSIYLACAWMMLGAAGSDHRSNGERYDTVQIASLFVFTLVPIAIAYHLAHYLSFLLMAIQYLIPLTSDPLGLGWDLFDTARYIIKIGVVDARTVWYVSVTAIVIGHIAAVCLAHAMALRLFKDNQAALRSQYPMLALMVAYTMVSLWIIAQPIVNSRAG